jgi:hypothetical protein
METDELRANCDGQPSSTAVVTIDMTQPGNFSVSPKKCRVNGGRPLVWTTTSNPPTTFVVRFTGPSPAPPQQEWTGMRRPDVPPKPYTARIPRLGLHIPGGNNEYEYVVTVGGVMIDPSIIIEPN